MYGLYEPEVLETIERIVHSGDTVLDVGANIGMHTIALSRAVGRSGVVLAVEPDPENVSLLRENLWRNQCENVEVIQAALGPTLGVAKLHSDPDNKGGASVANLGKGGREIEVEMRTASSVVSERDLAFPKLDVEGAEPGVLSGLITWPPTFIFEFTPWQLRAAGAVPLDFLKCIEGRGYELRLIGRNGLTKVLPEEFAPLA